MFANDASSQTAVIAAVRVVAHTITHKLAATPLSRARGYGRGDDTKEASRRWARSQSPLRQLLKSSSRSRPSSPKKDHQTGGGGRGGGHPSLGLDQLGGHEQNAPPINGHGNDGSGPGELAVPTSHHVVRESENEGSSRLILQQQLEHKRVRSVHHPVSYDECHLPSEEEQLISGGGDGCDSDSNSNSAVGGAISGDEAA